MTEDLNFIFLLLLSHTNTDKAEIGDMYKDDNMYGQVTPWGWAATLDLGNDDDDAAAHGDDGKDGND